MKIKLISPKSTLRPMDSLWKTHMAPPLSLLVLGALTPRTHQVEITDENVQPLYTTDRPDLVGITVKVDTFQRSCEIAAQYRRRHIPVVMGGIHPTAVPATCTPHADAVVVGEAETLWPKLLEDLSAGKMAKLYQNQSPVPLETVPLPDWSLIDHQRYMFTNTMTIGRGCNWRCDFCYNSSPNLSPGYRMKPLANIIHEIDALNSHHIMFIDDNFIGNPQKIKPVVRYLRERNIQWHTAVSTDIGKHEELLDLMADSGCKSLFIGFESVNQSNLLNCHKRQNRVADYDNTIKKIHDRGIMVNASLVFGFDGDTPEIFKPTLDWLVGNRIATMTAHILTPYPGTALYQQLLASDRIFDHDLSHYNTAHVVFHPSAMSAEELQRGYLDIYDDFYSWPNILRRWPVSDRQIKAFLEFNLLYRKFGKLSCHLGEWIGMRNLSRFAKFMAYPRTRGYLPRKTQTTVLEPTFAEQTT